MTGGDAMLAAAEAHGTLLVINHNARWDVTYRRLKAFVAAGSLGELTSAEVVWPSGRMGVVGTHQGETDRGLRGLT
jgi:predicted dehydrogenase